MCRSGHIEFFLFFFYTLQYSFVEKRRYQGSIYQLKFIIIVVVIVCKWSDIQQMEFSFSLYERQVVNVVVIHTTYNSHLTEVRSSEHSVLLCFCCCLLFFIPAFSSSCIILFIFCVVIVITIIFHLHKSFFYLLTEIELVNYPWVLRAVKLRNVPYCQYSSNVMFPSLQRPELPRTYP